MINSSKPTDLLIPREDYVRIHSVIASLLDGIGARTMHACLFFSVTGAIILRQLYGLNAQVRVGAALYRFGTHDADVICFGRMEGGQLHSDENAFHAWIECDGRVVDLQAPRFGDLFRSRGRIGAPPAMFQRSVDEMAADAAAVADGGEFYLCPDAALTGALIDGFGRRLGQYEYVSVCLAWMRRPPTPMPPSAVVSASGGTAFFIRLVEPSLIPSE